MQSIFLSLPQTLVHEILDFYSTKHYSKQIYFIFQNILVLNLLLRKVDSLIQLQVSQAPRYTASSLASYQVHA